MSSAQKSEEAREKAFADADASRREMEEKIAQVEREIDEERRSQIADISRTKSQVLKLMQVEI